MNVYRTITPAALACLLKNDNTARLNAAVELIDIRPEEEIDAFGAIPGAINLPCGGPGGLEYRHLKAVLERIEMPAVLYCHSGRRSAAVCAALIGDGYVGVYELAGGLSAWLSANLPVEGGDGTAALLRDSAQPSSLPRRLSA